MAALHQFGAQMLNLSRGLDAVSSKHCPMSTSSSTTFIVLANDEHMEMRLQRKPLLPNKDQMAVKLARERNR